MAKWYQILITFKLSSRLTFNLAHIRFALILNSQSASSLCGRCCVACKYNAYHIVAARWYSFHRRFLLSPCPCLFALDVSWIYWRSTRHRCTSWSSSSNQSHLTKCALRTSTNGSINCLLRYSCAFGGGTIINYITVPCIRPPHRKPISKSFLEKYTMDGGDYAKWLQSFRFYFLFFILFGIKCWMHGWFWICIVVQSARPHAIPKLFVIVFLALHKEKEKRCHNSIGNRRRQCAY